MGYEQHIKRLNAKKKISLKELVYVINLDNSLSFYDEENNIIQWNKHPLGGIDGEMPLMYYSEGWISSRHPDEFVTLKMFELAKKLNANLCDDESIFDNDYQIEIENYCSKTLKRHQQKVNKPWWIFW